MRALESPDEARRFVNRWDDQGATSFKAYMQIHRDVLGAAIAEAHKRGMKVTGHLCSVTYREAAALGIDDLEHGFLAATDFVADKKLDECPRQGGMQSLTALEVTSPEFTALVAELVKRKVAITSTMTVFETFTGRPCPRHRRPRRLRSSSEQMRNPPGVSSRCPPGMAWAPSHAPVAFWSSRSHGGWRRHAGYSTNVRSNCWSRWLLASDVASGRSTRDYAGATPKSDHRRRKLADLVVISGDPSARIADAQRAVGLPAGGRLRSAEADQLRQGKGRAVLVAPVARRDAGVAPR
jgi:hypothetical protein